MKQSQYMLRGNSVVIKKAFAMLMTFSLIFGATNFASAAGLYSITGSGSVSGATVTLTGTSHANPQTGANGTQYMAVDWDEDMDNDPTTGTGWEVAPAGGLEFDPVFFGSGPSRGFDDNDWDASHTYTSGGTYNISVIVYHGQPQGNDGDDFSTFSFEAVVVIDVCENIDGVQETVPEGYSEENGQCTPDPVDVCENIDGVQETVPEGYVEEGGQCTPEPVDVCDNIDGVQETVPEGYSEEGGQCTLDPIDVCENIDGVQEAVPEGYVEEGGICTEEEQPVDVCDNIDGIQETVPEGYEEEGGICTEVAEPADVCENIDGVQETVPEGYVEEGGICTEEEEESPSYATIVAAKVVCEDESYLPNWGGWGVPLGGITENTVDDFLSDVNEEGEVCYRVLDWQFQWATGDVDEPADNLGELGDPWNTFTGSTTINIVDITDSLIKVREVWNDAYLGFSGVTTTDDVSPEMYCNTDTYHYDNLEYIEDPQADETYYCAAFNVLAEADPENQSPNADAGDDATTTVGLGVNFDGTGSNDPDGSIVSYDWDFGDGNSGSGATTTHSYSATGTYYATLTVTDDDGATSSDEVMVVVGSEDTQEQTDVCENLEGNQSVVPDGYSEENGQCTPVGGGGSSEPTDLCPNLDGIQTNLNGKKLINGECIPYGGGGGGYIPSSGPSTPTPPGLVLGAATGTDDEVDLPAGCGEYLSDYLRMGRANNSDQVVLLQDFLNRRSGANLPLTGYFGPMTFAAVEQFQVQHAREILSPWVPFGLPTDQTPTGYVYKTTKRWINIMECEDLDIPMPQLP